jgi:hypothetical protein
MCPLDASLDHPLRTSFDELFKVVTRRVALLTALLIVVATAIEAACLVNQFAPLILLATNPDASALSTAQLQARWHPCPGRLPDLQLHRFPCA